MLRPFIRVARPKDWSGRLAHVAIFAGSAMALLPMLLIRLPPRWVEFAWGRPIIVRAMMLVGGIWLLVWMREWLLARLPGAPYLVWRTLVFPDRGQRRRVHVRDVQDVYVELRPPGLTEILMIELADGSHHELCGLDWAGAGRLFRALAAKTSRRANAVPAG